VIGHKVDWRPGKHQGRIEFQGLPFFSITLTYFSSSQKRNQQTIAHRPEDPIPLSYVSSKLRMNFNFKWLKIAKESYFMTQRNYVKFSV
jgi:hypothetical protein